MKIFKSHQFFSSNRRICDWINHQFWTPRIANSTTKLPNQVSHQIWHACTWPHRRVNPRVPYVLQHTRVSITRLTHSRASRVFLNVRLHSDSTIDHLFYAPETNLKIKILKLNFVWKCRKIGITTTWNGLARRRAIRESLGVNNEPSRATEHGSRPTDADAQINDTALTDWAENTRVSCVAFLRFSENFARGGNHGSRQIGCSAPMSDFPVKGVFSDHGIGNRRIETAMLRNKTPEKKVAWIESPYSE